MIFKGLKSPFKHQEQLFAPADIAFYSSFILSTAAYQTYNNLRHFNVYYRQVSLQHFLPIDCFASNCNCIFCHTVLVSLSRYKITCQPAFIPFAFRSFDNLGLLFQPYCPRDYAIYPNFTVDAFGSLNHLNND